MALAANLVSATINLIVVIHPENRICCFPSTQLPVPRTCKLLRNLYGNLIRSPFDIVVRVQIHQLGLEVRDFLLGEFCIGTDNDAITWIGFVCGRAVDRNDPAARLGANGIGRKTLAIIQVVDMDLLVLVDAGLIQKVRIDRTRALEFELGVSDPGLVQFCF